MRNIYDSPSDYGLTLIDDIDFAGSWEFDITAIYRDETGRLCYLEDSGCSCPVPFEDVTPDDLVYVSAAELQAHLESKSGGYREDRSAEIADLMLKVTS
jgi:hypothetical protein